MNTFRGWGGGGIIVRKMSNIMGIRGAKPPDNGEGFEKWVKSKSPRKRMISKFEPEKKKNYQI